MKRMSPRMLLALTQYGSVDFFLKGRHADRNNDLVLRPKAQCVVYVLMRKTDLGWQLQDFGFDSPQEVWLQSRVELLNLVLGEFFVLFGQADEVSPFPGIQEVHEIEQLPDVVIQRRLR